MKISVQKSNIENIVKELNREVSNLLVSLSSRNFNTKIGLLLTGAGASYMNIIFLINDNPEEINSSIILNTVTINYFIITSLNYLKGKLATKEENAQLDKLIKLIEVKNKELKEFIDKYSLRLPDPL